MSDKRWTPLIGIQHALGHLALRAAIITPLWLGVVLLLTPLLNYFPLDWRSFAGLALLLLLPGVAVGYCLGAGLHERAGMVSWLVAAMAMGVGWGSVFVGVWLANIIQPLGTWQYGFAILVPGLTAMAWLARITVGEA